VSDALGHVLRHNAWANKALLEFCAALDPSALALKSAGTYGTLHGTLQHIVAGEQFYIRLLTGELVGTYIREHEERRALGDLAALAVLTGARAIEIAATDDGARTVDVYGHASTAGVVLAQMVNHGNEHRGHATTILSSNGRATPVISAWRYGLATGISAHDGDS
jgi:uncharacterized damage-inducible protein DinB